jgi:hypothetical protein
MKTSGEASKANQQYASIVISDFKESLSLKTSLLPHLSVVLMSKSRFPEVGEKGDYVLHLRIR